MEAWKRWLLMAQEALVSAQVLAARDKNRSSASRAYYAAYQAATALLLYAGQVPPVGHEAWSHEATPELLKSLPLKIIDPSLQRSITKRLTTLYDMRLNADYHAEAAISTVELRTALRSAAFIAKIANGILPGD